MERITVILIFLFISCGNEIDNKVKENDHDNVVNSHVSKDENQKKSQSQPTQFYIKDQEQYSKTFLAEFKKTHSTYTTVALINDTIIINNDRENIVLIPTDLPLNKLVTYEENAEAVKYTLTVTRINISTLEYNYFETVKDKKQNEQQGQADLEPVFYYGAEGSFEGKGEKVYGMNEYINSSKKDCQTLIYIGVGSIEKSFLKQLCKSETDTFTTPLLTNRTK